MYWDGNRTLYCEAFTTRGSPEQLLARLRARHDGEALATFDERDGGVHRVAFYLAEADGDARAYALLASVFSGRAYLLLCFYFDDPADVGWALACLRSVRRKRDRGAREQVAA